MNSYYFEKRSQVLSNECQAKAYFSMGSTAVIAGPGSGKTTILSLKIIKLLNERIKQPQGLACITYSREAAREIKNRLRMMGFPYRQNVFIGTVHSFCIAEILFPFARLYGYSSLPNPLRIVQESQKKALVKKVLLDLKLDVDAVKIEEMDRERKQSVDGISQVTVPSYDIDKKVAIEYENRLHNAGLVDFEDIINFSMKLINENAYVRKCIEAKFPWFLIDEYQDLGRPLHQMVLSLFIQAGVFIFAVGDPDQSIYGFQGSMPEYLEELTTFTKVETIRLEKNFRSTQDIIEASGIVLQKNRGYVAAQKGQAELHFVTCDSGMDEQYERTANSIIPYYRKLGVPLEEIAVLVSQKSEVVALSKCLDRAGIPNYIARHGFERTELVQWLEDCAAWCLDSSSQSFDELSKFWEHLYTVNNSTFLKDGIFLRVCLNQCLIENKKNIDNPYKWLEYMDNTLKLRDILSNSLLYPDEVGNLENLFESVREDSGKYSIESFSKLGKPINQVTISTRHSSKGLEFEVVIMLGMEEGRFPFYTAIRDNNIRELEESQRICFVCVSRAKRACILVRSKQHTVRKGDWSKTFDYEPSRYWKQLLEWKASNNKSK